MPAWRPNALHLAAALLAGSASSIAGPVVEPGRAVVLVIDRWASASTNPDAAGDLPPRATAKIATDALLAGLGPRDVFSIIVMQRAGGYTQGVSCQVLELPMAHVTLFSTRLARARIAGGPGWTEDGSREPWDRTPCLPRGIERAARELIAHGHGRIVIVSDEDRMADNLDEAIALAHRANANGTVISTIGIDAPTEPMQRIAAAGGGRAYPAHDDAEVAALIARELAR